MDKEKKVISFDTLKERNTVRKKYKEYDEDQLINLLLEYHKQCTQLFDLSIKSRKLLIEYRGKYNRLDELYTESKALLKQEQEHARNTVILCSLMENFIIKEGLENAFQRFINNTHYN